MEIRKSSIANIIAIITSLIPFTSVSLYFMGFGSGKFYKGGSGRIAAILLMQKNVTEPPLCFPVRFLSIFYNHG